MHSLPSNAGKVLTFQVAPFLRKNFILRVFFTLCYQAVLEVQLCVFIFTWCVHLLHLPPPVLTSNTVITGLLFFSLLKKKKFISVCGIGIFSVISVIPSIFL